MTEELHTIVDDLIGQIAWKYKTNHPHGGYEDLKGELWCYYISEMKGESRGAFMNVCFTRKAIDVVRSLAKRNHIGLEDLNSEASEVSEAYSKVAVEEMLSLFEEDTLHHKYMLGKLVQLNLHQFIPKKYNLEALKLDEIIGDNERSMSEALINDYSGNSTWRNMKKQVQCTLNKYIGGNK